MKTYKLLINNEHFEAKIVEYSPTHAKINLNGTDYLVQIEDDKIQSIPKLAAQEKAVPLAPAFSSSADLYSGEIRAPLPGTIMDIKVQVNDYVHEGDVVLVLEAMKMESDIYSPRTGKISKIYVQKGDLVQDNDPLIEFED